MQSRWDWRTAGISMKRFEQERLLREILEDGEAANLRAASLAGGGDYLRRRRRRNQIAQVCATAMLSGLLIFGLVFHLASRPAAGPPGAGQASAPRTEAAKVKIITDEELFALFPNRAMALIGRPGQ